jgi:AcrR family transcriptional regulator
MSNEKRPYRMQTRAARQDETRRRIVAAAAELHQEVGPLHTTVAEIARRAGVQRPTVYNHFPDERELFSACSAHYLAQHPPPEFSALISQGLEAVLLALYRWYRATERMSENIARDRRALPALDELLRDTADAQMSALADALAAERGHTARVVTALALDFWTWYRLDREGLDDTAAARLMTAAVAAAA